MRLGCVPPALGGLGPDRTAALFAPAGPAGPAWSNRPCG